MVRVNVNVVGGSDVLIAKGRHFAATIFINSVKHRAHVFVAEAALVVTRIRVASLLHSLLRVLCPYRGRSRHGTYQLVLPKHHGSGRLKPEAKVVLDFLVVRRLRPQGDSDVPVKDLL